MSLAVNNKYSPCLQMAVNVNISSTFGAFGATVSNRMILQIFKIFTLTSKYIVHPIQFMYFLNVNSLENSILKT